MKTDESSPAPLGLNISAVERETGLSKDLLRVWERRYGFPEPLRDSAGQRVYSSEQLNKLRLVRRLMSAGLRPGRLLGMSIEALQVLLEESLPPRGAADVDPGQRNQPVIEESLQLLKNHRGLELRSLFQQTMVRDGLFRFLTDVGVPLTVQVGESWLRGEIQVFEEHLFTEQFTAALRGAMPQGGPGGRPRVLLTSLPGEPHGLGLLMAEAALRLERAETTSLGPQTPVDDVVAASQAHRSDIVALSFSQNFPSGALADAISELRLQLPESVALWCGGAGVARLRRLPPQTTRVGALEEIAGQLTAWRAAHAEPGA